VTTVVCTLFEGGYEAGAAALLNSLHRSGFEGEVVCGHRGARAAWSGQVQALEPLSVVFQPINRPEHLTYVKPRLMQDVLHGSADVNRVVYLDPDVVVKCRWDVVESWMDGGVAAVEDVNGNVPAHHPMRTRWRQYLEASDVPVAGPRNVYVNAGFLGVPRKHAELLTVWWELVQGSARVLGGLSALKNRSPNDLFHSADQDALNMALEVVPCDLSWVGREGMDFAPGGSLLSHAIGQPKPWEGRALGRALSGYPPSAAHREFLRHTSTPLAALGSLRLQRLRADLMAATLVSRVWRRAS
jgi:hypothetical protein